ncbi:hypothetical protein [Fimbriiglobus ruber]|uniref:hypothetical protein n=1 Tax=Fimbriiglobus ruber TaxID=1908690 RepID=UPI000B4A66C8|nr:hypothetical protein [Fimbriiglobus ruber]
MTLAFTSLGTSPLTGKAAVDNAIAFKRQLRSVLPFIDGASAMIVTDAESQRCEVRAVYDRGDKYAVAWATRAAEVSPEIWETMAKRRRERE